MDCIRPPLRVLCVGEYDGSALCRSHMVTSNPSAKYWYNMPDELAFNLPNLETFVNLYPDPKADPSAFPQLRKLLARGEFFLALHGEESPLSERSAKIQQRLSSDWTEYMSSLTQFAWGLKTKAESLDPDSMTSLQTVISKISQLLQLSYRGSIITREASSTQKAAEYIINWHREYCYLKAMNTMDVIAKMYSSRKTELKYFANALWQPDSPKSFDLRNMVLLEVLYRTMSTLSEAAELLEILAWRSPTYQQLTTHWNLGALAALNDLDTEYDPEYVKDLLQWGVIVWGPAAIDARIPDCWPSSWLDGRSNDDAKMVQIVKETAWRMKEQVNPLEELRLKIEIWQFNRMAKERDHEEFIIEQGSVVTKSYLTKLRGVKG